MSHVTIGMIAAFTVAGGWWLVEAALEARRVYARRLRRRAVQDETWTT